MSIGIKGSKEFYAELQEGEECVTLTISKSINEEIEHHINGNYMMSVSLANNYYETDEHYRRICKDKKKINKLLEKREDKLNNK